MTRRGRDLGEVALAETSGSDDMGDARLRCEPGQFDARRRGGEIDHAVGVEHRRQRFVDHQNPARRDAGEQARVGPERRRALAFERRRERHAWRLGDRFDQHPAHAPRGAGDD